MEINISCTPSEESCWNDKAIRAHVEQVNAKEARLAENPDLTVFPGSIACIGCIQNQWGNGTICSAQLTKTQIAVDGEQPPHQEDAFGSMSQISGFMTVKPGSEKMSESQASIEEPVVPSEAL